MPAVTNIPGLPAGTLANGTEEVWVVQNGRDVRLTAAQIAALGGSGGGGSPNIPVNLIPVNGVVVANGSLSVNVTDPGIAGQVLTSNGPFTPPSMQPAPAGTVPGGGTGLNNLVPQGGLLVANGVNPINITDPGTAGQVLTSNGAGVPPTMQNASASSGTVPNGGTGRATLAAHGVLIGEGVSPVNTTTAGTAGQVLTSNGSSADPTFQAIPAPFIDVPHGGTGVSTFFAHGLLVGNGVGVVQVTSPGTAGQVLTSTGASSDPTMQNLNVTVPQGGTGAATLAAHGVVIGEGAAPVAVTTPGTAGQALISNGAAADPTFQTIPVPNIDVAHGGTGVATLTLHGVVLGQGTSPVHVTGTGAAGQVLTSNGSGLDPTFQGVGSFGLGWVIAVPGGAVDVTAALQASINAAQSAGVMLYMPAGTYTITPAASGGLKIRSALAILADPNAHIVAAAAGSYTNCDMVNIAASGVSIEGGVWDWQSRAGSGNFIVNATAGFSGITLRKGTYQNAVYGCVQATDCSNLLYEDCSFLNNAGGDINVVCAGANVDVVRVINNYHVCPASNFEAVNIVNLSGATKTLTNYLIEGGVMLGSSAPSVGSCGIQIWANSSNYQPGPGVINNNTVFGFAIGISAAFCTNVSVTGNTVLSSSLIAFEMAGQGIACSGNVCEGNQITQYGFTTDGAPNNNFSGNTSRDCILYAFSVTNGGSDNALFTGCHAYQSAVAGAYSAFAIFGINNVTLSGCTVNYLANTANSLGVYAVDVGNLTITGCEFQLGLSTLGHIYIDNSTGTVRNNIKIKNNTFSGSVTGGNVHLIGTSYGSNIDIEGLASGALTQATSKSTALASGTNVFQIDITMNNATLAAGAIASFNWPNIFITANDNLHVEHVGTATFGAYSLNGRCGAGSATIDVRNGTPGPLGEAIVLRAVLTKSKAT